MRHRTKEITKASNGSIRVVTWEWNNGWNLVDARRATAEEIQLFNMGNGLPVKLPVTNG